MNLRLIGDWRGVFWQTLLNNRDSESYTEVLIQLSTQIHPLVLGQIFRSRNQIRFLAEKLLRHQGIESDKKEAIVSFLCSDSGSHDHTINRREAKELGLVIEKPSKEFYPTLRKLQNNISDTLLLRSRFSLDTELSGQNETDYGLRRAMIESVAYGSHHFVSEGKLTEVQSAQPGHQTQFGIQDNRNFDGWRREV